MSTILQGTTPTLVIEIDKEDVAIGDVALVELVFHQTGYAYLTKSNEDCVLDQENNSVSYHFTEEETLAFDTKKPLVYQMRIKTTDGEVLGTEKTEISIADLMRNVAMEE